MYSHDHARRGGMPTMKKEFNVDQPAQKESADDESGRDSSSESWDPYEVWRTRIKEPRELQFHVNKIRITK